MNGRNGGSSTIAKLSIQIARLEEQMKNLGQKIDTFILAALNPEMGYVTRQEVSVSRELVEKDTKALNTRVENLETRVVWLIGLLVTAVLGVAAILVKH